MTTTLDRPAELHGGAPSGGSARLRRLWRGSDARAAWERPALLTLLAATAVLYLWNLSASGYGNSFYAAAVQAGTRSWKAFFFGSSDASNFITVDKPPASLWVMELSARIFGLNSWSLLVPQALEGVATVGLLYAAIRRWFSAPAALIAGATAALTPVAVLMFKFDNPDALLVLLLTGSAYALLRAVESGRTRWLVLAATLLGTGFLTKSLQAFLVLPVYGLVYLVCGPHAVGKRVRQLAWGLLALLVASGWWVLATILTPAADRPYIGGSQDNSVLNLVFGYNGFGRLTGNENGSVVGGGQQGSSGMWGATGFGRMFNSTFGGQASWLIPSALVLLVFALWLTRRGARTDLQRASLLVWGGWLLVTGLTFSLASGIIHPYYTVALVPAIGALVGAGAHVVWAHRSDVVARVGLAGALVAAGLWSYVLLDRTADWLPWLRVMVIVATFGSAVLLLGLPRIAGRVAVVVAGVGLVGALAGSTAYALDTTRVGHTSAIPSAGPAGQGSAFGGPGGRAFGGARGGGGFGPPGTTGTGTTGTGGTGTGIGTGGAGGPGFGGQTGTQGATGTRGGFGGAGGLLGGSTSNAALTAALKANASAYTWVAATVGSNTASGYQLASGDPVMAIGGFNGTDPAPSLAQFEKWVAAGKIHYFIPGGGMFGGNGSTSSVGSQITTWVEAHYASTTVGGTTVYDLTAASSTSSS